VRRLRYAVFGLSDCFGIVCELLWHEATQCCAHSRANHRPFYSCTNILANVFSNVRSQCRTDTLADSDADGAPNVSTHGCADLFANSCTNRASDYGTIRQPNPYTHVTNSIAYASADLYSHCTANGRANNCTVCRSNSRTRGIAH